MLDAVMRFSVGSGGDGAEENGVETLRLGLEPRTWEEVSVGGLRCVFERCIVCWAREPGTSDISFTLSSISKRPPPVGIEWKRWPCGERRAKS